MEVENNSRDGVVPSLFPFYLLDLRWTRSYAARPSVLVVTVVTPELEPKLTWK